MQKAQAPGFTALELLVTMAIIAITLAIAVPYLKNYNWNLRMQTAMDTLQTDLTLTRSSALSYGIQTVICPAATKNECLRNSEWHKGWMVFADLNGDRQRQEGEPLLKKANAIGLLTISSARSRSNLRFHPNGTAAGSNASVLFCDKRGSRYARKVILSNTGRIRTDSDGISPTAACM